MVECEWPRLSAPHQPDFADGDGEPATAPVTRYSETEENHPFARRPETILMLRPAGDALRHRLDAAVLPLRRDGLVPRTRL
jgi:hypothetical protein